MTALRSPYENNGGFRITSPVGYRNLYGQTKPHYGLDLVGTSTQRVVAVRGGRVVRSRIVINSGDATWEWGNYVAITDDYGQTIYYCHLDARYVADGETVEAGQLIGLEGNTGASTGRHLHLEVREGSRRCSMGSADTDDCSAAVLLGVSNEVGTYTVEPPSFSASAEDDGNEPAEWSLEAVKWALANNLLLGDEHGNLCLHDPCTREMAVVFLHRFWKLLVGL